MASAAVLVLLTFLFGTTAAQCPQGYNEISGECFYFEDDLTGTFSAGQLLCELKGGRLAFIDDCEVLSDVVLHIQENGLTSSPGYWLGGTDLQVEGTFEWFNGDPVPMGTPFWGVVGGALEPSGGEAQNCLFMNANDGYFFGDSGCDMPNGAVCQPAGDSANTSTGSPTTSTVSPTTSTTTWSSTIELASTTDLWTTDTRTGPRTTSGTSSTTSGTSSTIEPARCPAGFEFVISRCLRFMDKITDSWSNAELRCQLIDAHLAVVEGCNQLKEVVEHIVDMAYYPYQGYWLGATDIAVEGRFEWISGATVSKRMPLWGTENGIREPSGGINENCLAMIADDRYYFHDRPCSETTMGAICELPPILAETIRQDWSDGPNKI